MVKKILKWAFLVLVLLFMYAPILLLVVYSFNDTNTIGSWGSFSFTHYEYLFKKKEILSSVTNSITLALVVATLSTLLGTAGAIGIFYSKKRAAALLSGISQIPVINAEIVTALSIAVMVSAIPFLDKNSFVPMIFGLMVLCTPFVVLSVMPKLKQMDNNLYEAALDLGATPTQALFKVVIPQILPGILSGFMLAITLSLDDYVITAYTKPNSF
ncbi:MAG: ABC transporter permease, partial [Christensenellaceae bacterium]